MRHLLVTLLLFFLITPQVFAGKNTSAIKPFISVYPVIFNVAMRPGKTTTHEVVVTNLLDTPLPLHSSLESFNLSDTDYGEKPPASFSSWAQIDQPDMILAPHASKRIHIRVSLPKKLALGGYYANLNLEPKLLTSTSSDTTHIRPRIAILFLGSVGVPSISNMIAAIEEFRFPFLSNTNLIHTLFKVKNTSLYHFSAKPHFEVSPLLGDHKQLFIEEKIILPGRARTWDTTAVSFGSGYNIYKVQLQISVGNGVKISEDRYLIVFPYKLVTVILGILATYLLVMKRQRQIKTALGILFSGKNI